MIDYLATDQHSTLLPVLRFSQLIHATAVDQDQRKPYHAAVSAMKGQTTQCRFRTYPRGIDAACPVGIQTGERDSYVRLIAIMTTLYDLDEARVGARTPRENKYLI